MKGGAISRAVRRSVRLRSWAPHCTTFFEPNLRGRTILTKAFLRGHSAHISGFCMHKPAQQLGGEIWQLLFPFRPQDPPPWVNLGWIRLGEEGYWGDAVGAPQLAYLSAFFTTPEQFTQRDPGLDAADVVSAITQGCKQISKLLARANILGVLGSQGTTNIQVWPYLTLMSLQTVIDHNISIL